MYAAIMLSRVLCLDEVDQLQEAESTSEVPLGDELPIFSNTFGPSFLASSDPVLSSNVVNCSTSG